jgi:hypothetical protein
MYVFLDDVRFPEDVTIRDGFPSIPKWEWTIVRNIDEFRTMIEDHLEKIEHIAFDHDLGLTHYSGDMSDEKTGYDCAKILVDHCIDRNLPLPNFSCHSMNPAGRENILKYLESFRRHSK